MEREVERLVTLAAELVDRALARGIDVAEARVRSGSELSVQVRLGETELVEEAGHRSAGMRVMKDGRVALTSTSDLTESGLERFIADAVELVEIAQEDPFAGPADPSLVASGTGHPDLQLYDPSCGTIDAAQAIEIARRGEAAARGADPRITNSDGATFTRTAGAFGMVLSGRPGASGPGGARAGSFRGGYASSYASLSVIPIADDEGNKKRKGHHWSARRFFADLDTPEAVGREAARRTLRKLGARKVPTQEVPVIFDPDAARSILGLVAGVVSGGAVWRKSSYLVGREGTRVASDLVTIVDDPSIPRAPGSRPFDGEGLVSRKNVVVDRGTLKTFLCDSYAGRKLGRPSTASAGRGAGGGVGATTTNFILQPTATAAADIVASTKRGLFVTDMMGHGFNPVTGDFSRGASGFWIEDGQLAFPVSEITISLPLDDLLQRIDAVGDDLDLRSSVAAPTIRVSSMTLAGG